MKIEPLIISRYSDLENLISSNKELDRIKCGYLNTALINDISKNHADFYQQKNSEDIEKKDYELLLLTNDNGNKQTYFMRIDNMVSHTPDLLKKIISFERTRHRDAIKIKFILEKNNKDDKDDKESTNVEEFILECDVNEIDITFETFKNYISSNLRGENNKLTTNFELQKIYKNRSKIEYRFFDKYLSGIDMEKLENTFNNNKNSEDFKELEKINTELSYAKTNLRKTRELNVYKIKIQIMYHISSEFDLLKNKKIFLDNENEKTSLSKKVSDHIFDSTRGMNERDRLSYIIKNMYDCNEYVSGDVELLLHTETYSLNNSRKENDYITEKVNIGENINNNKVYIIIPKIWYFNMDSYIDKLDGVINLKYKKYKFGELGKELNEFNDFDEFRLFIKKTTSEWDKIINYRKLFEKEYKKDKLIEWKESKLKVRIVEIIINQLIETRADSKNWYLIEMHL